MHQSLGRQVNVKSGKSERLEVRKSENSEADRISCRPDFTAFRTSRLPSYLRSMNYFELFELPETLKPDGVFIKKKFYELSRKYHPDFFANASEEEQASVLEKSSMVNRAFKIFQSEEETIKYVLQLKNLIEEEEKYNLKPDFLMEVLEINEQLMEAETVDNEEGLSNSEAQTKTLLHDIYEEVKLIIAHYQEGVTTDAEMLLVKDYYYKKKYLQRILGKIAQLRNIAPRF
jgi:molecular chaperone HscB